GGAGHRDRAGRLGGRRRPQVGCARSRRQRDRHHRGDPGVSGAVDAVTYSWHVAATNDLTTPADLMRAASAESGLDDFGDDSFRAGLEILVRALRKEARLNAIGELALPQLIVNLLSQRLQIEDWYRRHPDIAEVPLGAPLIGLGLPRTGSTALSFLLAE